METRDDLELLDGGADAFPRMLTAIDSAQRSVHLEIYTLAMDEVGSRFVTALQQAARRGVKVRVILDGWGSVEDADEIFAKLTDAGVSAAIYNPISRFFLGRWWRNHRKILIVDERIAFLGGINIAEEYLTTPERPGWADLAVSIRGRAAAHLAARLRGEERDAAPELPVKIRLSGMGGGSQLRRRYLKAIGRAKTRVLLAHAYFLPDPRTVRSLRAAARRGVRVQLLLAGRSDVALARAATMRLYRDLLLAGVEIHEWTASVLHAKAAVIDSRWTLVGSFNLDPLSLTNLEALVEVDDFDIGRKGDGWIERRLGTARKITLADCERGTLQAVILDRVGLWVARLTHWVSRVIAPRRSLAQHREGALRRSQLPLLSPKPPDSLK